jgi:hypothetical protein
VRWYRIGANAGPTLGRRYAGLSSLIDLPASSLSSRVVDRMNASAIGRTLLREIWLHTVSLVSLMTSDDRRTKTYKRGLELLKANLTPAQLNQLSVFKCFERLSGFL